MMKKKYYLYVLLTLDFIYVGITSRYPPKRWLEHLSGEGAVTTANTKIISILDLEVFEYLSREEAENLENNKVKELRKEFGDNYVFGGKYINKKATNLN